MSAPAPPPAPPTPLDTAADRTATVKSASSSATAAAAANATADSDVVNGLRVELRNLYESLAEKNDLLLLRERDVRELDSSVQFLRNEYDRMRNRVLHNSVIKDATTTTTSPHANQQSAAANDAATTCHSDDDEVLGLLQKLTERDVLIEELSAKCLRLTHDLAYVQRNSIAKDERIRELQTEMDKFRQIIRPLTEAAAASARHKSTDSGTDEWRTPLADMLPRGGGGGGSEARVKRQAISAEPLAIQSMKELRAGADVIPKSSL